MLYGTNILMKHEHYSRKEITVYQNIANGEILCVSDDEENIQNYECCRKARNCLVLETIRLSSNITVYRVLCKNIRCEDKRKEFNIKIETMWSLIVKTFKLAKIYVRTFRNKNIFT